METDGERAARIEEGLSQAHALVEDFKEAWSRGHLVDAGGLQVKVLFRREEQKRQELCELRFVLRDRLQVASVAMTEEILIDQYEDPDVLLMQKAIEQAVGKFRIELTDAVFESKTRGWLPR